MVSNAQPTSAKLSDAVQTMRCPANVKRTLRPSLGKRAVRLSRFLIVFCIGVAATLTWQSYGNAARELVANSSTQLGWLAPQTTSVAPTPPGVIAPPVLASPSPELEELEAMSLRFALVQKRVDQLAASQQKISDEIANLRTDQQELHQNQQELHQKISAPPPRPTASPSRKPEPPLAAQAR